MGGGEMVNHQGLVSMKTFRNFVEVSVCGMYVCDVYMYNVCVVCAVCMYVVCVCICAYIYIYI